MAKWIEREIFHNDDKTPIESWQSAKCSNCGLYHTTPYQYYFTDYEYCPHCGEKMVKEQTDGKA